MDTDRQFVTALARGVAVLRCFTVERPELGGSEIAALTGLPQPTVWRLCHTLRCLGLLVPGSDPSRLRPGYGLLSLGVAAVLKRSIAEAARPGMQEIAARFGVAVSLAARDGLSMLIIQRAEAPTILRLDLAVGAALPIARSALGWAYLAGIAAAEREELMAALARAEGPEWPRQRAAIADALADHARHGCVFNLRHFHPDVNAVGVPVGGQGGRQVLALNCGGAGSTVSPELLAGPIRGALMALAADLAHGLGAEG